MKTLCGGRVLSFLVLSLFLSTGSSFQANAVLLIDGSTDFDSDFWDAEIFWKVYSPHDATSPLGDIDEYSYFYQIFNYATSTMAITGFHLENPTHTPVVNAGFIDGTGLDPYDVYKNTSIDYLFWNRPGYNELDPGTNSDWLYLTGDYGPDWVTGHLRNSADVTGPLPFPNIPEPGTLLLLGSGLLGLVRYARRKKGK